MQEEEHNCYNLMQVVKLMKENDEVKDNVSFFERVYKHNNFKEDTPLLDYIEYIFKNTDVWVTNSLPKCKSIIQVRKHIFPINKIIKGEKYPQLAQIIPDTIRKELPKKFTNAVKNCAITRNDETEEEDTDTISIDNSDDCNSIQDDAVCTLQKEINELKLNIIQLQKDKEEMKEFMIQLSKIIDNEDVREFVKLMIVKRM